MGIFELALKPRYTTPGALILIIPATLIIELAARAMDEVDRGRHGGRSAGASLLLPKRKVRSKRICFIPFICVENGHEPKNA